VIGGILNAAGVSGFLENREALYEQMDDDTAEWRAFVLLWWDAHQGQVVTVSDLWELVSKNDALNERLGNGTDQARKSALGKGLSKLKDRIIGGYQITLSSKPTRKGSRAYYLMPMPP
jgi:putative DNA primase/helicase